MKQVFRFLFGYSVLEIKGTACGTALNKLARSKIAFWNVLWMDAFTIRISVFPAQKENALVLIASAMCDGVVAEEIGLKKQIIQLKHRILFLLLVLVSLASAVILPRYVFFYEVVGNETVPAEMILQELRAHGIGFGTYGPDIRPAWIKNHLIDEIPKLQWLTVIQNGCRAKVVVRERPDIPETENRSGFSNVVASQNGMITKMSVFAGQPVVKTGDIVAKGQLLVSGVVDLERVYVLENANAEIFARTWREVSVCMPEKYGIKTDVSAPQLAISIQIGQKRIKLFGNSGISHGTCDKMITRWNLTLPGDLSIPFSLEVVHCSFFKKKEAVLLPEEAELLLSGYVEAYVENRMKAGVIQNATYRMENKNGRHLCHSVLECHEMIAERVSDQIRFEE